LAAQANGEDPIDALKDYAQEEWEAISRQYEQAVGAPPGDEQVKLFNDGLELARVLLVRYFDHYGWVKAIPEQFEFVAVECTFRLPIPGTEHFLRGTFDALMKDVTNGEFWVKENKTFSDQPDASKMRTDDQLTGYSWAAQELFGVPVAGVLYDGISKKMPRAPTKTVDGRLSRQWIDTDYETYRQAIQDNVIREVLDSSTGELIRVPDHNKDGYYDDILHRLKARDEVGDVWWKRFKVYIPQHSIEMWGRDLARSVEEMANNPAIYPNFRWEGCWDCDYSRDLCPAIQLGEDSEWVMKSSYIRSEGHRTFTNPDALTPEVARKLLG